MSTKLLNSALKLSESERILLAEQIWDSVAKDQSASGLTEAQKTELDQRLARISKTGTHGSSWDQVKKRLNKRKT